MSSSVAKKYSYRSSVGRSAGNSADVTIEYSADLTALSRLEVSYQPPSDQDANLRRYCANYSLI